MPVCPRCRDEYTSAEMCATCRIPLVPDGTTLPPQVDRLLGTFHPLVADRVVAVLARRGIAHEALPAGDDQVEVVVDGAYRDDLRAELAINWDGVVNSLDVDARATVIAAGAHQPGWWDAPTSAWVDREGRMQVDAGPGSEDLEEAGRLWGPTLMVIGTVTGIFGWYGQGSSTLLVLGLLVAALGVFLPR
jgi:hypothetical protein